MSDKGSVISQNKKRYQIKAYNVSAVDSTGAGDMYVAGLLYGLSRKFNIKKSAELGSFLASRIVTTPSLMPAIWDIQPSSISPFRWGSRIRNGGGFSGSPQRPGITASAS